MEPENLKANMGDKVNFLYHRNPSEPAEIIGFIERITLKKMIVQSYNPFKASPHFLNIGRNYKIKKISNLEILSDKKKPQE